MKIAIDIRAAGGEKAGKGWYTFNLVKNLLEIDKKNEYLLYSKDKIPGFDHFKNTKIKVINSRSLFWHLKVAKDMQREGVDIFFAPTSYIIPILLSVSIKTVLTVHDLVAFLFPKTHNKKAIILEKLLLKKALKKSAFVITVSENTKLDLLKLFKFDRDKMETIYCAAAEEFRSMKKEELHDFIKQTNLPSKFFLAVGTLEPRKNYLSLIEAFARFNHEFPDYHLIIVGQKGWNYEGIHELIRQNYLGKKVHLLGYISNKSLMKLYNLAEALVFPSFYEGFGMPPLEAMQSGCPVICSNTSSLPEVVEDNALLINPEYEFEISNAMVKIVKNKELRQNLISKGLLQTKKFSWKKSAEKLLRIFEEI